MKLLLSTLICVAVALWLAAVGPLAPPDQAFAQGAKKAMPVKPAPAEDENLKQLEQHFAGQFQGLHRAELHFMRLVCQPTKAQYDQIAAEGQSQIKEITRKYALMAQHGRSGAEQFDPRRSFTEAMGKSVQTALTPEQAERYQKELTHRTAARKHAMILALLAQVDRALVLTAAQRGKVEEVLTKKWNDSWNQPQMYMSGGLYFPPMPDADILPILTETQKTTWNGIPKGNVNFGWNNFANWLAEEEWEEAQPRAKPAPGAGEKKEAKSPEKK